VVEEVYEQFLAYEDAKLATREDKKTKAKVVAEQDDTMLDAATGKKSAAEVREMPSRVSKSSKGKLWLPKQARAANL